MLEGIYSNAANMIMLERWQASISQNLSSSQAAGFKRTQFSVNSESSSPTQSGSEAAASMPVCENRVDLSPGAARMTNVNTDLAINGPGFFQIQGANGNTMYTRNGEFRFNSDNTLVTSAGQPLMGEGGPIMVDPDDGVLTVSADGTLSQGDNTLGRIPIYDFSKGEADLTQIPGGFLAKKGVVPTVIEEPAITQGAIEGSNVSPVNEMISLIMVSNAYQSSQKLMTSHDTLIGQAIQALGAPPTA